MLLRRRCQSANATTVAVQPKRAAKLYAMPPRHGNGSARAMATHPAQNAATTGTSVVTLRMTGTGSLALSGHQPQAGTIMLRPHPWQVTAVPDRAAMCVPQPEHLPT